MANILINGIAAKAGGGKNILDNYLLQLQRSNSEHQFFVLTPDKSMYEKFSAKNIHVVDVPALYKKHISFLLLYYFKFPQLIRQLKIDVIFNFGDVIIPTKTKQVYFFDWAYAVYDEDYIWSRMGRKDFFIRKLKVFLIGKYIHKVNSVLAQTTNMASRLKEKFLINNIVVIPTPVDIQPLGENSFDFKLPQSKIKLLFPASYSSHKNYDVIIPLAELIEKKGLPFTIILTIDKKDANVFLSTIEAKKLESIINVGKVSIDKIPSLYTQSNALFFPTLLESFGIPYVEAMRYGKPIFTSDLDFAREICGDLAYYFDPFDENSILSVLNSAFENKEILKSRISEGEKRATFFSNWENTFKEFQFNIEETLK